MNNTLYIIGNGFDLHHGMHTSYLDYYNQCVNRYPRLSKYLYAIYGEKTKDKMWWSHFEEMLGQVDYIHLMNSHNGMAMGAQEVSQLQKNEIPTSFGIWLDKINYDVATDDSLNIDINAQFFTFNYTMTLEKLYGVNKENIWHIHNSLEDFKHDTQLIIGHDSNDGSLFRYLDEYQLFNRIDRMDIVDSINREINKGAKKVKLRINHNCERFCNHYSNIKNIVCMGFSFNSIDMPYIKQIIDVNQCISDVYWIIYWYSNGEDKILLKRLLELGIEENNIQLKRWN